MIYVSNGFSNAETYAFSNGTQWIRFISNTTAIATDA